MRDDAAGFAAGRAGGTCRTGRGAELATCRGHARLCAAGVPDLPADLPEEKVKVWMGHRPSTPDGLPCIGPASGCPDVVHAFGHGHVGLTAGAATARLVADMISGKHPSIGAAPYSASRFESNLSRIAPALQSWRSDEPRPEQFNRLKPPASLPARPASARNTRSCGQVHHPAARAAPTPACVAQARCQDSVATDRPAATHQRHDAGLRTGQPNHPIGQFGDRNLVRIPQVDRACDVVVGGDQSNKSIDQIIDIAG